MNFANPVEYEDSQQFFKEEQTSEAIYNLYLKKIRYHTLDDEEILASEKQSHLLWRTHEIRIIKAGTLNKLIEALSSETGEIDSTYVNIFLSTYRAFASAKQVLNSILNRYKFIGEDVNIKQEEKEAHRKTLRIVISIWIDGYSDDFNEPPHYTCLQDVIKFAESNEFGNDVIARARSSIIKFQNEEEQSRLGNGYIFKFNVIEEKSHYFDYDCKLERPVELTSIPSLTFASQLTYMDAELFKKVVPSHCLGCIWSRRDKKKSFAPSVYATVDQFNSVSYRVIATILKHPLDIDHPERARIIEKWIEIAQCLRQLKNFSSLKAILSALQSNTVYRLYSVWSEVGREFLQTFSDLAEIFSEDNNQSVVRELLMKEGTAKFAEMVNTGTNTFGRRKKNQNNIQRMADEFITANGTVPYLGTFLTDLTMLDAAISDYTDEGLINFEKRRKEFEILAQIRLLQSAANLYRLKPDPAFMEWFHNLRVYDECESFDLSCEIEPAQSCTPKEVKGHRKKSSLGFFTPRRPTSMGDDLSVSSPSILNSEGDEDASSLSSCSISSTPSTPNDSNSSVISNSLKQALSLSSLKSSDDPWRSAESCVVKVTLETSECHYSNLYKSILIRNSDHTKSVIQNILSKFDITGKPEDYIIIQILKDNELFLPEKGNIFYAINNSVPEIKFIVRKKSDIERIQAKQRRKYGAPKEPQIA